MSETREKTLTMEIFIHNLTRAQAIAIEDLLATWQQLGSVGSSRWTSFMADGDGNFRPTCIVNGHIARHQYHVDSKKFWQGDEYRIDFDAIAWALRAEREQQEQRHASAEAVAAVDPHVRSEGTPTTREGESSSSSSSDRAQTPEPSR